MGKGTGKRHGVGGESGPPSPPKEVRRHALTAPVRAQDSEAPTRADASSHTQHAYQCAIGGGEPTRMQGREEVGTAEGGG
jgi:hypothetical protein